MSIYEAVEQHHRLHGDDFGREESRNLRYGMAVSLLKTGDVLDVGCGSGQFRDYIWAPDGYTGIDLLEGTNILDYTTQHDNVVALGILYRVPHGEQNRLIAHMWTLARKVLIVQTISKDDRDPEVGEWPADPLWLHSFARTLTPKIALRTDYLSGDLTLALYR